MTRALVSLTADTVDRIGLLGLYIVSYSIESSLTILTRRYSLVASCHSLVIDRGGGRANEWMVKKMAEDTATPIAE